MTPTQMAEVSKIEACCDGKIRDNMLENVEFITWHINQMPKNHFISY